MKFRMFVECGSLRLVQLRLKGNYILVGHRLLLIENIEIYRQRLKVFEF